MKNSIRQLADKIQNFKTFLKIFNFALCTFNSRRGRAGFTLVELLVVIAMLGILAGAVLTLVNPVKQIGRANDAKRKSNIAQLQRALELYNNDNNSYPEPGCGDVVVGTKTCCSSFGNNYIVGVAPNYMVELPHDPLEPTSPGPPDICYGRGISDATGYRIDYRLENRDDTTPGTFQQAESIGGKTFYAYAVTVNWKF